MSDKGDQPVAKRTRSAPALPFQSTGTQSVQATGAQTVQASGAQTVQSSGAQTVQSSGTQSVQATGPQSVQPSAASSDIPDFQAALDAAIDATVAAAVGTAVAGTVGGAMPSSVTNALKSGFQKVTKAAIEAVKDAVVTLWTSDTSQSEEEKKQFTLLSLKFPPDVDFNRAQLQHVVTQLDSDIVCIQNLASTTYNTLTSLLAKSGFQGCSSNGKKTVDATFSRMARFVMLSQRVLKLDKELCRMLSSPDPGIVTQVKASASSGDRILVTRFLCRSTEKQIDVANVRLTSGPDRNDLKSAQIGYIMKQPDSAIPFVLAGELNFRSYELPYQLLRTGKLDDLAKLSIHSTGPRFSSQNLLLTHLPELFNYDNKNIKSAYLEINQSEAKHLWDSGSAAHEEGCYILYDGSTLCLRRVTGIEKPPPSNYPLKASFSF